MTASSVSVGVTTAAVAGVQSGLSDAVPVQTSAYVTLLCTHIIGILASACCVVGCITIEKGPNNVQKNVIVPRMIFVYVFSMEGEL